MHKCFSPNDVAQIEPDCRAAKIGCVDCKKLFAKNLNAHLAPFRDKRNQFAAQPNLVWDVLADGAQRARAIAGPVLAEVKAAIGLP
jgi:tryptophanyl-tRNA synthetase